MLTTRACLSSQGPDSTSTRLPRRAPRRTLQLTRGRTPRGLPTAAFAGLRLGRYRAGDSRGPTSRAGHGRYAARGWEPSLQVGSLTFFSDPPPLTRFLLPHPLPRLRSPRRTSPLPTRLVHPRARAVRCTARRPAPRLRCAVSGCLACALRGLASTAWRACSPLLCAQRVRRSLWRSLWRSLTAELLSCCAWAPLRDARSRIGARVERVGTGSHASPVGVVWPRRCLPSAPHADVSFRPQTLAQWVCRSRHKTAHLSVLLS